MKRLRVAARSTAVASLLASGLAVTASAQSMPLQLGVDLGAAVTTFVGRDAEAAQRRTSPFGGLTLLLHKPGALVGFQSGLLLVPKGVSVNEEGVSGSIRLRYLEMPLLLRIAGAPGRSGILPAITAGVTVGARIGCKVKAEFEGVSAESGCESQNVGQAVDFNRFEAGVAIGGEVAFPYRKRLLIVPMLRYTRGLTKIGTSDGEDDIKNQVVHFGVGLRFRR